ncbi:MAG: AbrB/MazE/SpoVT family DNA-binding domain-containing protein [Lentisphaerae bacterium]|nr:AbrB/MazE/SpoVT family DNA-binding domain-containing protein [Lentisphaerota bacterium]
MKATLSEKGQVTVPKGCRDRLGLRPGTVIDFEAVNGQLIGVKRADSDPFRKWRGQGRLPGGLSVDRYLARVRA